MKKLVTTLVLGLVITSGAYAQDVEKKDKRQRRTDHRVEVREDRKQVETRQTIRRNRSNSQAETLSEHLGLSEVQKNQLQVLNMKRVEELQALNEKYDKSDTRNEAQRAERKAIQERWQVGLKNILDEKQYAAFEADRQMKRENFNKTGREKVKVDKKVVRQKRNQNR